MIKLANKKDCCGCNACAQRCPKSCITMQADSEGFLYPQINAQLCNNCGLCEKVCPVINQDNCRKPLKVYAAINKNEDIRIASSSGGVFSAFAQKTLSNGGVVFGAAFNKEWGVEHIYIDSIEELKELRGSKYVQSNIGNTYKEAEKFLKQGREVLFSGTPCQIAALKLFLRKEYDNLTTLDIVCHGAPSPKVWKKYLIENCKELGIESTKKIKSIKFRDKVTGWKRYSISYITDNDINGEKYTYRPLDEDIFMQCFLSDLCLRPSCYNCPARNGKSGSDITLADLWGATEICPELDDDKGLSLVLVRNEDKSIPTFIYKEIDYNIALKHNMAIKKDFSIPHNRNKFFSLMEREGVTRATMKYLPKKKGPNLWSKLLWNIKHRIFK